MVDATAMQCKSVTFALSCLPARFWLKAVAGTFRGSEVLTDRSFESIWTLGSWSLHFPTSSKWISVADLIDLFKAVTTE